MPVRKLIMILVLMSSKLLFAQNKITLISKKDLPEGIQLEKIVSGKKAAELECIKAVNRMMNLGYLLASCDSILLKNDTAYIDFYVGRIYAWGDVKFKYLPKEMIRQFGFDKTTNGIVNLENYKKSMNKTLIHFENKGYPFAYFYWDSIRVSNDSIMGSLRFEKNIAITFDTLAIYGDAGVNKQFLYNYLGFKPGQLYEENIVKKIPKKMSGLPFTSMLNKPQIYFVNQKAIVLLNLKKRATDRLDGIVGFAPNTGTPDNSKLLVTGEFHLDFKNLKGSGIGLRLDWQSFQARSQALNAGIVLPYILNQPIGADLSADFLKYDTFYTETRFNIGMQYLYSGLNNLRIYYEQKNTNLISVDTFNIRSTGKISDKTAMRSNRYGLALSDNTFDNRLSPQKGSSTEINLSVFKRTILKDDRISRVKFYDTKSKSYYTVYDSMELVNFQFLLQYQFSKAIKFYKKLVLFPELKGFHLLSPNLYFNELTRFGGNYTLRGFNEQSLFASSLNIFNLEIRYLLSENSFLKLFGNAAYYEDKSNRPNKIEKDVPYGFGGGINLETAGGIFNISVALGKSKFNPIDFKNAKIHFGLVNYF